MGRVSKDHEVRRNELLDIAQQMFFEGGYETTSVNDIIEKAGVAKGTFYHYFKSKEDLLDSLVDRWNEGTLERVRALVTEEEMPALEKLKLFFRTIRDFKVENIDLMITLMKVLYRDENLLLRHKIFKKQIDLLVPEFVKVIKQGESEAVFETVGAEGTAEFLFQATFNFSETIVDLLLQALEKPELIATIMEKAHVYERLVERILSAESGSFRVVDRKIIEKYIRDTRGKTGGPGGEQ
jgi:AcrR family transcriptional regulator